MATEIKMPQLSDTMNSGKILAWRKKEGDQVKRGDILAEVETDKANLEIESFNNGTLLKISVPAEQTASVGDVICVIGEPGEKVATNGASSPKPVQPSIKDPTPSNTASIPAPQPVLETSVSSTSDRVKVSPLAKKLAQQRNIDLSTVQGTGPNGRIVKKDLESEGASRPLVTLASPVPQERVEKTEPRAIREPSAKGGGTSTPLSKMRETIARRMVESVTDAPHFYVTTSVCMDEAFRLREILKGRADYKGISINHMVIKAVAYGLMHEPRVNSSYRDGAVFEPNQINIGIITALEDGLLIPVVREADKLPLKDIVFEARAGVERAKAGRPSANDLTGGTFSISNMGMFDVENFTAIINPGQGGVLAVSATKEVPIAKNGQILIGLQMKATVSVDHRVIDGVMAANFLKFFKEALETPALLMV